MGMVHLAATLLMTGLIWFVQVVHYPLFAKVGAGFSVFELEHARRTGWVVGPLMVIELASAGWLLWHPPSGSSRALPLLGLGLLAVIWTSTAFLQVPCHRVLGRGFDAQVHSRLVRSNWIRTAAWTGRSMIAVALVS